jgi:predicted nucleotidyltransferase
MQLRNKDKQSLVEIFSFIDIPMEVWAYGSRVRGTAHEGSDLDLVVRSQTGGKLPLEVFLELKEKIQKSNIPIVVELLDWARLPESFHLNIVKQHEVFFNSLGSMANEPQVGYKKNK